MSFMANRNYLKMSLSCIKDGDTFISHNIINPLEQINKRFRGYVNKFTERLKPKNYAEELSKDEKAILSKEEVALWESLNKKTTVEELTEDELVVLEKVAEKRSKDAFGDNGVDITEQASDVLKNDIGLNANKNKSREVLPYDLLSKKEQAIWDRLQFSDKAYEEFTQEEKEVVNKYTKLAHEGTGGYTACGEEEKSFNEFINGIEKGNQICICISNPMELIGYKIKGLWGKLKETMGK